MSEQLEIYEEDISKTSNDELKDDPAFFIENIVHEINNLLILSNEKKPHNERLEASEKLKGTAWKCMEGQKEEITALLQKIPDVTESKDLLLVLRCAYIVTLELSIKELEISILEDMYDN